MSIKLLQTNNIKANYFSQYWIFIFFLGLAFIMWVTGINQSLFLIINEKHNLLSDKIWKVLNFLSYSKFGILPILLLLITIIKRRNKLVNVIILIVSYYILFTLLKKAFGEARPYMVLAKNSFFWLNTFENSVKSAYHSFPSGHTGNMAVFAFAVSIMFFKNNNILQFLMLLLVILVALSRICTGWHWPLDVISGGLIGYMLVKICLSFNLYKKSDIDSKP